MIRILCLVAIGAEWYPLRRSALQQLAPLALTWRPMKRKYGAALARESIAEQMMRERAKEMRDNRFNFGSKAKKGSSTRGKRRGRAFKPAHRR